MRCVCIFVDVCFARDQPNDPIFMKFDRAYVGVECLNS